MAEQAYSTSRRAMLTGICIAVPAAALAAHHSDVERAEAAFEAATGRKGFDPFDSSTREFKALAYSMPRSARDHAIKARFAFRQLTASGGNSLAAAIVLEDMGAWA